MNGPLVSIIIPCYNGARFLDECIRSVVEQKMAHEIILVDDGSTDDSRERANLWLRDGSANLVVMCQKNQGPAVARNTGLRMAQGKYVGFLDVDDEYAPDFLRSIVQVLESDPEAVAAFCQIELVQAHRPVADWQRDLIENSLPSNAIVRTQVARRLGGFPTQRAFRGQAAGEDSAFRQELRAQGKVVKVARSLLRYRVQRGSHFDFFLDRIRLESDRLVFTQLTQEEQDGSLTQAFREYAEVIRQRAIERSADQLQVAAETVVKFHQLSRLFDSVVGFLHPIEGFLLYWLAQHWPVKGQTVEIGSFKGRSTCWLAAGCRDGNQSKVAAVDHFRGSPEHQREGTHEDPDVVRCGSTLPIIQAHLEKFGLSEWANIHAGSSAEISGRWHEPVRLLFIDGDHAYESTSQDFAGWSRFVVRHGLVVFHDVEVWPGVTRFYQQLCASGGNWRVIGRFHTIGIVERLHD